MTAQPGLELGPAVTDEFTESQALGVHELIGRRPERASVAEERTAPPPSPSPAPADPTPPAAAPAGPAAGALDPKILQSSLEMIDAMTSAFLGVEKEPAEFMEKLSAHIKPLADYYASGSTSVSVLWAYAALGVGSYGLMKWERYRQTRKEPAPDTPSGVPVDEVATPPGASA